MAGKRKYSDEQRLQADSARPVFFYQEAAGMSLSMKRTEMPNFSGGLPSKAYIE